MGRPRRCVGRVQHSWQAKGRCLPPISTTRAAERAAALPLAKCYFCYENQSLACSHPSICVGDRDLWQAHLDTARLLQSNHLRDVVRANAVGPPARCCSKGLGRCSDGKGLRTECLRGDFVAKLHNRTRAEMAKLDDCAKQSGVRGWRLPGHPHAVATQAVQADGRRSYIYRSIYFEHLQGWLKFYPPSQLLVLPSEACSTITCASNDEGLRTFMA